MIGDPWVGLEQAHRGMMWIVEEPLFRPDLYKGTAAFYDRFRPAYPAALLDDLMRRAQVGQGARLLDLACGTGQIAFGLHQYFAEVWAVDQEAESVEFARSKALHQGAGNIRWIAKRAENLDAGDASFDLVAIGNAFHRLRRRAVAENAYRWLKPGAPIALLWGGSPWEGRSGWELALAKLMQRWIERAGATDRVPAALEKSIEETPQQDVLAAAGFEVAGKFEFVMPYAWTVESLVGFMFSTSVLSRPVLGELSESFEADLRAELLAIEPSGAFRQDISFAYDFARRPSA